jgi:hypothetical protein
VATPGVALLHVPPTVSMVKVVVNPVHTILVPLTVTADDCNDSNVKTTESSRNNFFMLNLYIVGCENFAKVITI